MTCLFTLSRIVICHKYNTIHHPKLILMIGFIRNGLLAIIQSCINEGSLKMSKRHRFRVQVYHTTVFVVNFASRVIQSLFEMKPSAAGLVKYHIYHQSRSDDLIRFWVHAINPKYNVYIHVCVFLCASKYWSLM